MTTAKADSVTADADEAGCLYIGAVTHHRHAPRVHRLRYRLFSLYLDLDRIDELDRHCRLFSRNRFNLFSFRDTDHGNGSKVPLIDQIRLRVGLADPATGAAIARVGLLCMPRILGYVFNPLSVFYCFDGQARLVAMVYEVNNTFGQRHHYVIPVTASHRVTPQDAQGSAAADPLSSGQPRHRDAHDSQPLRQISDKRFHVSPFLQMALRYVFRVAAPAENLHVAINVQMLPSRDSGARKEGKPMLDAVFSGRRMALTDAALLRLFFTHPLLTLKVTVGIHWEALFIWRKTRAFHRCPPAPPVLTIVDTDGACRDVDDPVPGTP